VGLGVLHHLVDLVLDRPEPSWMVMEVSLPVPLSVAVTWTIPFASMSMLTVDRHFFFDFHGDAAIFDDH
jgi:hypothetical protein